MTFSKIGGVPALSAAFIENEQRVQKAITPKIIAMAK